jgi:hypothetical protein
VENSCSYTDFKEKKIKVILFIDFWFLLLNYNYILHGLYICIYIFMKHNVMLWYTYIRKTWYLPTADYISFFMIQFVPDMVEYIMKVFKQMWCSVWVNFYEIRSMEYRKLDLTEEIFRFIWLGNSFYSWQ